MSKLEVDAIEPQSGTTLTIGASGDTVNVASGATLGSGMGKILQVVQSTYSTAVVNSTTTYADTGLTASITPISTSNKILVLVNQPYRIVHSGGTIAAGSIRLLRDSTVILGGDQRYESYVGTYASEATLISRQNLTYLDSPSTTSSVTYKTQLARYQAGDVITTSIDSIEATITLMEVSG